MKHKIGDMIKIEKTTSNTNSYHVYYTDVYLGDAVLYEDGFFYFHFANDGNKGYWQAYILRAIADKLDELNKELRDYIDKII